MTGKDYTVKMLLDELLQIKSKLGAKSAEYSIGSYTPQRNFGVPIACDSKTSLGMKPGKTGGWVLSISVNKSYITWRDGKAGAGIKEVSLDDMIDQLTQLVEKNRECGGYGVQLDGGILDEVITGNYEDDMKAELVKMMQAGKRAQAEAISKLHFNSGEYPNYVAFRYRYDTGANKNPFRAPAPIKQNYKKSWRR